MILHIAAQIIKEFFGINLKHFVTSDKYFFSHVVLF